MIQAYVYNGKEVFLTGRTAKKKMRRGGMRELYEVRPIKYLGKKELIPGIEDWVRLSDLYEINTGDEENNDDD